MTNPHGSPIWYELISPDPDASKAFYDAVIGWNVGPKPDDAMDYRMIHTGDGPECGEVGGVMRLTEQFTQQGARPEWLFYVGVDDVEATVGKITAKGGAVLMPAMTMEGVGRMALVADPQGVPFYVMRGASDESSTAFDGTAMGKCAWNELSTPDQAAANAFYADIFGWTYPDKMAMPGDMGDYVFVQANDRTIGATWKTPPDGPPAGWQFYFRAPDIKDAAGKVKAGGGTVHTGPMEVPGGDMIIVAGDPHGVMFGVIAPGK